MHQIYKGYYFVVKAILFLLSREGGAAATR